MPAAVILRLARTRRCAIVASRDQERAGDLVGGRGRRACAGSARPGPRAASAGWQQVKISSSRSSGKVVVVHLVLASPRRHLEQPGLRPQRAVAADAVDRRGCAPSSSSQPRRVRGRAVARPALGGDRERLLRGLLGEVEVAEEADQRSEDAPPLLAEDARSRISHRSHQRAHLDRAAHARRRDPRGERDRGVEVVGLEAGSSRRAPPWLSTNGPSVVSVLRPPRAPWSPSRAAAAGRRRARPARC